MRSAENRSKTLLLALLLLLVLLQANSTLLVSRAQGEEERYFYLAGYTFLSSTRDKVYSGSSNTRLTIEVEYYGLKTAENVHACISLPEGFTTQNTCVEARNEDGERNTTVTYGAIVYFYYTIDVDKSVKPGTYPASLKIKYSVDGEEREERTTIHLSVDKYPQPRIVVEKVSINPYAYPGTRGASIEIVFRNDGDASVQSGYIDFVLPKGFTPQETRVDLQAIDTGSRATITIDNVFISPSLLPSQYWATGTLTLTMSTSDGVTYNAKQEIKIPLRLEKPPAPNIILSHVEWSSGEAFPGTKQTGLNIYLTLLDDYTVNNLDAWLILPRGMKGPNGTRVLYTTSSPQSGYASTLTLRYSGINVDESLVPGKYNATLRVRLHVSGRGAETILWYNTSIPIVLNEPREKIRLIDVGWNTRPPLYEKTIEGTLYVSLQYLGTNTLEKVRATLMLENARTRTNSSNITVVDNNVAASYGSVFTLQFPHIVVENETILRARLVVEAVVSLPDGASQVVEKTYTVEARLVEEKPFILGEAHVEYNGNPSPVLPSARDLRLQVTLVNTMPTRIAYVNTSMAKPAWMKIEEISGSCSGGVAGGATCSITVVFNVSANAEPGDYNVSLFLLYSYTDNGMLATGREVIRVPIIVESPEKYAAKPVVLEWYWGAPGNPSPIAYSGTPSQELTIVLHNPARWSTNIVAEIKPRSNTPLLGVVDSIDTCQLGGGDTCSLAFTLNLSKTPPGTYGLKVDITYYQNAFGTHLSFRKTINISLKVESLSGQGLVLYDAGWQGDHLVFPGTQGAVLVVSLENRLPWAIQGAYLELKPPRGITPHSQTSLKTHVDGPIASLNSFTASFSLDVERETKPGIYNATLRVTYWYSAGGVLVERIQEYNVPLVVSNTTRLVEFLNPYYQNTPKPGDRGVALTLAYRLLEPDEITTPILVLYLPSGITDSYTGEKRAVAAPSTTPITQLPETIPRQATAIAAASMIAAGQQPSQSIVYYTLKLNIDKSLEPGVYRAKGEIIFTDSWGSNHTAPVEAIIPIPGGTRVIEVSSKPYSTLVNGTALVEVKIKNNGTAPAYNLYVFLAPQVPNAYPLKPVAYVPVLSPGEETTIGFPVAYSPVSPYGGESGYTFAGIVGILYQDPSGGMYKYNSTISTILRPPARIVFTEAKAEYRGGVLRISISMANIGVVKAERTIIHAYAGGNEKWVLIGDIDPGDEMPAKIEIRNIASPSKSVKLVVEYHDSYDNTYKYTKTIPVTRVLEEKTGEKTGSREQIMPGGQLGLTVTVAVIVFLAIVGFLLYRYLLSKKSSEQPLPEI